MIVIILYCIVTMLFTIGRLISTPPPKDSTLFERVMGAVLAIVISPIALPISLGSNY